MHSLHRFSVTRGRPWHPQNLAKLMPLNLMLISKKICNLGTLPLPKKIRYYSITIICLFYLQMYHSILVFGTLIPKTLVLLLQMAIASLIFFCSYLYLYHFVTFLGFSKSVHKCIGRPSVLIFIL